MALAQIDRAKPPPPTRTLQETLSPRRAHKLIKPLSKLCTSVWNESSNLSLAHFWKTSEISVSASI